MNCETNEMSSRCVSIKNVSARVCGYIVVGLIGCLGWNAKAGVQATRFDPPLNINAWADPSGGLPLNVLATDFDADGQVDFRLAYGLGAIGAYFNAPTRYAALVPHPILKGRSSPVTAVPLRSWIGSNIVSSVVPTAEAYFWSPGDTNLDDLTQALGDREAGVLSANIAPPLPPGPIISLSTYGTFVTNYYNGAPVVSGDVAGREAVMAVQFFVNGQPHYGYIHFDFRAGAGGVIYGWAYETEPDTPIKAVPLSSRNALKSRKPGRAAEEHQTPASTSVEFRDQNQ